MKHVWLKAGAGVVVLGAVGGVGAILFMDFFPQDVPAEVSILGGEVVNELRTLNAPEGTLSTEVNAAYEVATIRVAAVTPATADWPSYNRTLEGDRYARLAEITTDNVGELKGASKNGPDRGAAVCLSG